MNWTLAHSTKGELLKMHWRRGKGQGANLHELSVNKQLESQEGQQWVGDKPLLEARQVADHKGHLLSQWATPKVKWLCKTENKKWTITTHWQQGYNWQNIDLATEKGGEAKKQAPSK
jgi:hypothetical protein